MPIRLPRLTLFSGPQCSLCDIAKAELKTLRKEHNFELTTIDIHSPGQESWKRRYVYWIPALHLDDIEIAKGRWDATTVRPFLEKWKETQRSDGAGAGGHDLQHMDTEGFEIQDNLFFFDASAMTAWPTQVTQYTTAESTSTLGVPLQDASLADDEPPYDPDAEYIESGAKQCFNCMATTHIVSDCPHKRHPQHIALARADYGSRGGNTTRSVRLHEAQEIFKRRMEFTRTFEPGYVQGELLRESLRLSSVYGGGDEDLPWYYTMCDWGYPPGWVSDIDNRDGPSSIVSATHENPSELLPDSRTPYLDPPPPPEDLAPDDLPPPPPDLPPPPPSDPPPASPLPPDSLPFPPRRWVHYRTTLFQSERLPISLVSRPLPAFAEAPPPPPSAPPPPLAPTITPRAHRAR
ncbi:DUF836 family protein [Rhizoctonia solani AG-3 Rhs1AP]|uniref:DUF836 family protein n=1 Tax=Rhizoctonia solani AG-3 Rhs1AP TaxID=1086054 RepID=X8J327_9AGAM|nr:DUF836 family protein [Rhizoctonia solani AG-3 Rhs1AP]